VRRRTGLPRCVSLYFILIFSSVVACQVAPDTPPPVRALPAGAPTVRLYVEPDEGNGPVVRFVDGARTTLDVAMYLLSDRGVENALAMAVKRGVKLRVMLEEHPYGTGPGNSSPFQQLHSAGAMVSWSPSEFKLSHDKYAIADRRAALVGTANWTTSAFRSNREYLIEDEDAADVAALGALFDADWEHRTVGVDDARLVISPINSRADFLALIRASQRSVDVEAEEMQDQAIEEALGQAAGRGVTVRTILPASTGGTDPNTEGRARLAATGVAVRRIEQPYMHAKQIVVDREEAFVGSENISTQSLNSNREVGLLVADKAAVGRLEETFNQDWDRATS
jgi:phosphatidylserine/phosphatidylglycerophosphate/cardiolipin synthase-like enzyme